MAAILLGWNPERWDSWDPPYPDMVTLVGEGPEWDTWSVGQHKNIEAGADAWLLLQGDRKGLVGHATVLDEPYEDAHYADANKTAMYVELEWQELLPIEDRIPRDLLEAEVPGVKWRSVYSSGTRVPPGSEDQIKALWATHGPGAETHIPGEVPAGSYVEGAVRTIWVNRFERDASARQACLGHYGATCFACGLDPASIYGSLAGPVIHVHHIVPLSKIRQSYKVNPIKDLRPLCANCHSAVHAADPVLTPDQLRRRLNGA